MRTLVNRPLFVAIGVACAAVLVWFVGPLFVVGGVQPLAGEPARRIAIGGLVAVALLWALLRAVRSARRNARLIEGLAGPRAAPGAKDLAQIGQRFEEAIKLLKRTHLGGRRALLGALVGRPFVYQLPWYVIIGAPGAGKTTALVNSGLEFPLATKLGKKPVRGVGGTRNCDWWFATEAVLIDTAGRFTTQDSDRDADRAAWFGFLDLLVKYRPRRPVNGVLLTLSVPDLLTPDPEERKQHMQRLRERVDELHAKLGAGFPIYVMVTKLDLLAGFMEFFADFDKDERAQVWGVTFPYTQGAGDGDPLARLGADLAALEKRLDECLIDRLQADHDRERRAAIYAFPQQWRLLREALAGFLQGTFAATRGEIQPLVRGVYFTSATQEGTPVDRALGELARAMGLKGRVVAPSRPTGKTFFVTRFLRDVVFAEAGLAGTNLKLRKTRAILQWGVLAACGVLVAGALGLAWRAYAVNRDRVIALQAELGPLDAQVARARASKRNDLPALVPALDALAGLGHRGAAPSAAAVQGGVWSMMGLDQSEMLTAAAQDAYQHVLRETYQRRIAARLEERLRAGRPDNVGLIYEALKAYLMLYGGRNFDATALRGYLLADWETTLPRTVGPAERDGLRRHLDALLGGGEVGAPSRADRALIEKSRALVASVPLAQRIYDRLRSLDPAPGTAGFSVAAAAGSAAAQVFTRASGQPLTQGIPPLYTRAFLQQSLRPRSQDVLRQFSDESAWVLGGDKASAEKIPPSLAADIEQLYLADYARLWDETLRDVRLVKTDSLAKSAQVAQVLGGSESPLTALFTAVGNEVGVLARPAGATPAPAPATRGAEGDAASADRFGALARLASSQPPPLHEAVGLLAKLATHLISVEDAVKRRTAPPASDVTRELAAFAQRSPEPLAGMLTQLATASAGQVFAVRREELGRQVGGELNATCTRVLGARFPLVRKASEEISREDFARVFAAGGLMDNFFQRQLAPYVDTSGTTWAFYRPDGSTEPAESLQAFQRAQAIRDAFFTDNGRLFGTRLELRVLDMDAGVGSLVLDVDGQVLRFTRDAKQPLVLRWPGPGSSGNSGYVQARLFTTTPGGGEPVSLDGPWALPHLLAKLRSEPGPTPDRVPVQFNFAGRVARLEIRSPTHANLVRLLAQETMFQCPQRL